MFPSKCSAVRLSLTTVLIGVVCVVAVTGSLRAQGRQSESQNVGDMIEKVRQGAFTPALLNRLVQLRAVQAIPVLEQQFAITTDTVTKLAVASALVRLGDAQEVYWAFLMELARAAVESDAPFPTALDAEGKLVPRQLSPGFVAWARSNNRAPESASSEQVYELPINVTFLAVTGDARGLPVLQRGLSSRNYLIQAVAAKGLAKLQDRNSVPAIIEACRTAPAQVAELIARALVFFDDVRAQKAAETFIRDRDVLSELRRLSRELGPAGVF